MLLRPSAGSHTAARGLAVVCSEHTSLLLSVAVGGEPHTVQLLKLRNVGLTLLVGPLGFEPRTKGL